MHPSNTLEEGASYKPLDWIGLLLAVLAQLLEVLVRLFGSLKRWGQ